MFLEYLGHSVALDDVEFSGFDECRGLHIDEISGIFAEAAPISSILLVLTTILCPVYDFANPDFRLVGKRWLVACYERSYEECGSAEVTSWTSL